VAGNTAIAAVAARPARTSLIERIGKFPPAG
jgi:hypothetical protein